ncbi:hypothetical protein [Haliangium sp.]|uniref:hypothetical protein n=1 Tax=Haliangium sp. TaxID=2663208 RepID=UPI003D0A00B1
MTESTFQVLLFHPWAPSRALVDVDRPGYYAGGQIRQAPAPVLLAADRAGRVAVFDPPAVALTVYDGRGARVCEVAVDTEAHGPVVHLALAGNGAWLLHQGGPAQRLRKVDCSGQVLVDVDVPSEASTRVDRVALAPERVYLASSEASGPLLALDPDTGRVLAEHQVPHPGRRPAPLPDGRVLFASYFPDQNRRGVSIFDPETGREQPYVFHAAWHGPLLGFLGADARARLYLFASRQFSDEPGLYTLSREGAELARLPFIELVTSPEGDMIGVWSVEGGRGRVRRLDRAGGAGAGEAGAVELSAKPDELSLTGLTAAGAFIFDEMGENHLVGARWSVVPSERAPTPVALGENYTVTAQQHIDTWLVSPTGQVLIPVTTPRGVAVVAVTTGAQE